MRLPEERGGGGGGGCVACSFSSKDSLQVSSDFQLATHYKAAWVTIRHAVQGYHYSWQLQRGRRMKDTEARSIPSLDKTHDGSKPQHLCDVRRDIASILHSVEGQCKSRISKSCTVSAFRPEAEASMAATLAASSFRLSAISAATSRPLTMPVRVPSVMRPGNPGWLGPAGSGLLLARLRGGDKSPSAHSTSGLSMPMQDQHGSMLMQAH